MKSKSKEPKQIRYYLYMKWAIELRKAGFDIENDNYNPYNSYPKMILNVLREIATGNIDKLYCSSAKITFVSLQYFKNISCSNV